MAQANAMHGPRNWNGPRTSNRNFSQPKVVIANSSNSSDNILDQLANMSTEEMESQFGINLDVDTTTMPNVNTQPIDYDDFDDEDQMEFENDDLADAFADEIANLSDDEDKA